MLGLERFDLEAGGGSAEEVGGNSPWEFGYLGQTEVRYSLCTANYLMDKDF